MKLALAFLIMGSFVAVNAQFSGFPYFVYYMQINDNFEINVINSYGYELHKVIDQPNFPKDLSKRASDIYLKALYALDECKSKGSAWELIKERKNCLSSHYYQTKNALKTIGDEAIARGQSNGAA